MHQKDFPRAAFSSLLASYFRHFEHAKLETDLTFDFAIKISKECLWFCLSHLLQQHFTQVKEN